MFGLFEISVFLAATFLLFLLSSTSVVTPLQCAPLSLLFIPYLVISLSYPGTDITLISIWTTASSLL